MGLNLANSLRARMACLGAAAVGAAVFVGAVGLWGSQRMDGAATAAFVAKDVLADVLPSSVCLTDDARPTLLQGADIACAGEPGSGLRCRPPKVRGLAQRSVHAAREQSAGIGQVNSAVGELDRMTQQNAALVEQSAAAADSLKAQARTLAEAIARFRVDASASAAMPV